VWFTLLFFNQKRGAAGKMFCFSLEQIEFNTNSNTGAHGGVEKDDENKVSLWEYSSGYSHPSVGSPGAS